MEFIKNSALVVIDSQNEFVDWLPEEVNGPQVVKNIRKVIDAFHEAGKPVIFFRELHRVQQVDFGRELDGNEPVHCIEGSEAADFHPLTRPAEGDYFIPKRRYSGFFRTDLDLLLNGLNVDTLYVCGFLSDVCVHYTCVDAHQNDFHVKVFEEACGGSSRRAHEAALAAIDYLQHGSIISINDL